MKAYCDRFQDKCLKAGKVCAWRDDHVQLDCSLTGPSAGNRNLGSNIVRNIVEVLKMCENTALSLWQATHLNSVEL